jgi:hypothetical protein
MTHKALDQITAEVEANGVAIRKITELSEADYRARPEHSVSEVKLLPDEPELYYGRYVAKLPDYQLEPSPQMIKGTAVHEAVLQNIPLRIIPDRVLSKDGARRGAAWNEFRAEHLGEAWLKASEAEPLNRSIDSIYANKQARALLEKPGDCELSIFRRDEFTGLSLKHRLDKLVRVGSGIVLDVKTTNDPTDRGFPYACLDRKYHIQAAAYFEAAEEATGDVPEAFIFIAVQVEVPYICQVYTCDRELLDLGAIKWHESLLDLDTRTKISDWHRAGHGHLNILNLPKKAYATF